MTLEFHAVTPERWPDLDRLFSSSNVEEAGEPVNCWCMEWRLPRDEWQAGRGEGNRRAMQRFIESGQVPGILAYEDGEPVAWCSISPRIQHQGLKAIASYRNFENPDVWLVSCFYVTERARGRGLMSRLLEAAIAYAREGGAKTVEGYPADPKTMEEPERTMYWGLADVFRDAGFSEVARGADGRPVMRYKVEDDA
jgi:GNAT superfamily N-acetyltransferase